VGKSFRESPLKRSSREWPRRALLPATAALAAGLAGCGGSSDTGTPLVTQPGWTVTRTAPVYGSKPWTFLVYLNGANNLDADGVVNVNQMEQVGSNANLNVVVQWKRLSGWNGATRRYFVTHDSDASTIGSTLLSSRGDADMGRAQTLQEFVQWGVHAFPAQHYCLMLWDHGAGWRAQKVSATRATGLPLGRGISYDDLTRSHIDTTQIPAAIHVGGGFHWDLLAMDASLMQMAEVDYEMRDEVRYIVASEESPSELGYPYDKFLADLTANPTWDGKAFGIDIAQKTLVLYGPTSDATQSVVDAGQLAALAPAVDALGGALTAAQSANGPAIARARDSAESVFSGDYSGDYRDLTDFAHLLIDANNGLTPITDAGVVNAVHGVEGALTAAVVYNAHGNQHPHMNGLTIFLPTPTRYAAIDHEQATGTGPGGSAVRYTDLAFTRAAPNWASFLANGPQ
jgi:hypothetical protein